MEFHFHNDWPDWYYKGAGITLFHVGLASNAIALGLLGFGFILGFDW